MPRKPPAAGAERLERDHRFQVLEWRFQRAGWAVLGLISIGAGIGLLGPGPLSRSTASAGGLEIGFDRLIRRDSPFDWDLSFPAGSGDGPSRLSFSAACLFEADTEEILPPPSRVLTGQEGAVTYEFPKVRGASLLRIRFTVRSRTAGSRACRIEADSARALEFRQWAFP